MECGVLENIRIVETTDTKTVYSCGCVTEVIGKNFIINPCSLDCEVYKFVLEESNKQGNIISFHLEEDQK